MDYLRSGALRGQTTDSITIPAGRLSASIEVIVKGDLEVEGPEQFVVQIFRVDGAVADRTVGTGVIVDFDPADAGVSVADLTVVEPEVSDAALVVTTVQLPWAAARDVALDWRTRPAGLPGNSDTATPPRDFLARSGTAVIPAGHRTARIQLWIRGGDASEGSETFTVELTSVSASRIHDGEGQVAIIDRIDAPTRRVNLLPDGSQVRGFNDEPALSMDGRYTAFVSGAAALVPGDTNGTVDILVHDSGLGTTERVSVGPDGVQANGPSGSPVMSPDARYVAFRSGATNFVPDTNNTSDVFVRDTVAGQTLLASHTASGLTGNGFSQPMAITDDGRVLFSSEATDLDGGTGAGLYLFDPASGALEPVATDGTCEAGGRQEVRDGSISADGSRIAFGLYCTSTDVNSIVLLDRTTETRTVLRSGPRASAVFRVGPVISRDGRTVAFTEDHIDTAGRFSDLWISHDGQPPAPTRNNQWFTYDLAVSSSGRYVATMFVAEEEGMSGPPYQISPFDLATGEVVDGAMNLYGRPAAGASTSPAFSADETKLAFASTATDLTVPDTNGPDSDIYVRDFLPLLSS